MKPSAGSATKALTRIEVVVVIAVLGVLAICLLPFLARQKIRSSRVACTSNVKQIVLSLRMWSNDHNDLLPHRVPVTEGGLKNPGTNQIPIPGMGTFDPSLRSNVWLYFSVANLEICSPKVLFCPEEVNLAQRAATWTNGPRALISPDFQNKAVSYAVGLDADLNPNGGSPEFVAGARHIVLSHYPLIKNAVDNGCSSGIGLTKVITHTRQGTNLIVDVTWNKQFKPHGGNGNVGLLDGSVQQVTSKQVQDLLATQPSDNGSLHFLYP